MADGTKSGAEKRPDPKAGDQSIDCPRLTPQGRTDPEGGEDSTNPTGGGAKQGQPDKTEG
jgi:hypothetical protein